MKTQSILIVLILFIGSISVEAQEGLWDAIKQTAEAHDESRGLDDNNGGLSDQQEQEYTRRWEDIMNEAGEEYKAALNGLGAYEKCYALMVIYLDKLYQIQELIDNEEDCKMKYDLYGVQLIAISTGNTILYCPEKLSNLSEETQSEAYEGFLGRGLRLGADGVEVSGKLGEIIARLDHSTAYEAFSQDAPEWLINHFRPQTTVGLVLTIAQKMEALGCSG